MLRKKRKATEIADGSGPAVASAKDGKEMQRRQKIMAMYGGVCDTCMDIECDTG